MSELPLIDRALKEANGDPVALTEILLNDYTQCVAGLFGTLTVIESQPADLQLLRRKLIDRIEGDYVQAMLKMVENDEDSNK